MPPRTYEKDIKVIWEQFKGTQDLGTLVTDLDELFADQGLYHDVEGEKDAEVLEAIREEEVQLVCYQWFKPG